MHPTRGDDRRASTPGRPSGRPALSLHPATDPIFDTLVLIWPLGWSSIDRTGSMLQPRGRDPRAIRFTVLPGDVLALKVVPVNRITLYALGAGVKTSQDVPRASRRDFSRCLGSATLAAPPA